MVMNDDDVDDDMHDDYNVDDTQMTLQNEDCLEMMMPWSCTWRP